MQKVEQSFRAASVKVRNVANEGAGSKVELIIQRNYNAQAKYSQGPRYRGSIELSINQIETTRYHANI